MYNETKEVFIKNFKNKTNAASGPRVNEKITEAKVIVINHLQENLGEMPTSEALELAYDAGLDLVEISNNDGKVITKIIDYGKFKFEKQKKLKEAKKKQKVIVVKEIQLTLNIATHDYEFKLKHAKEFLAHDYKVKFIVRLRGRERQDSYKKKAISFLEQCFIDIGGETVAAYEVAPKLEGNSALMILASSK